MKTHRARTAIALALSIDAVIYTGGYIPSVARIQVRYDIPSESRVAAYGYTWQRALFGPIEHLDRQLFPAGWNYDTLNGTDPNGTQLRLNEKALFFASVFTSVRAFLVFTSVAGE